MAVAVGALVLPAVGVLAADPAEDTRPAVAYFLGRHPDDFRVRVANVEGDVLARFGTTESFSLMGTLLAREVFIPGDTPGFAGQEVTGMVIRGHNLATGRKLFDIPNAAYPTVLHPRGRVAFWGFPDRDPYANSVWIRELDGKVRRIVRFSDGPSTPGYDPGLGPMAGLLSTSFDRRGETLVVAQGEDVAVFEYDVFLVDVASGKVRRITSGKESRRPAISPNGERIAYQRDVEECGPPEYRAANLMLVGADRSGRRVLHEGSCRNWLHHPHWISNGKLVVSVSSRLEHGEYRNDLALYNVATGRYRMLTDTGDVVARSVSPSRNLVAYQRQGRRGFTLLRVDLRIGTKNYPGMDERIPFATGFLPTLDGDLDSR